MTEKTIRQIDTPIKVCYKCNSKAIVIVDKKYYCATCELKRIGIQPYESISRIKKENSY
jgi:hypothetical protein